MNADAAHAAARAAGWLEATSDGAVRLPSAAHRRAALAAADPALRARIATRALAHLPADDPRRADALVAAGRSEEAVAVLRRAAAAAARADGGPARAALLYERAAALAPDGLDAAERLALATGLGLLGRYDDAARALETARAVAADGGTRAACAEREAWLRARRGDTEGARLALERGLAEAADDAAAAELRARLGRLLVTSGRFRDALDTVAPLFDEGANVGDTARAVSGETAVLAYAYLGHPERAGESLLRLEGAGALADGRRAYLGALLAQLAGREADALRGYRGAYELASRDSDVHTVASVALNLAALLAEQGLYGEALAASERAVRELGRLGAAAELATALVNGANIFVQVGDLAAARRTLERARGLAAERKLPLVLAAAMFVDGDLALRSGQPKAAASIYPSGGDGVHGRRPVASRRERDVFGGGGGRGGRAGRRGPPRARRGGRAAAADRGRRRARPGAGAARARRRRRGAGPGRRRPARSSGAPRARRRTPPPGASPVGAGGPARPARRRRQ